MAIMCKCLRTKIGDGTGGEMVYEWGVGVRSKRIKRGIKVMKREWNLRIHEQRDCDDGAVGRGQYRSSIDVR